MGFCAGTPFSILDPTLGTPIPVAYMWHRPARLPTIGSIHLLAPSSAMPFTSTFEKKLQRGCVHSINRKNMHCEIVFYCSVCLLSYLLFNRRFRRHRHSPPNSTATCPTCPQCNQVCAWVCVTSTQSHLMSPPTTLLAVQTSSSISTDYRGTSKQALFNRAIVIR